MKAFYRSVRKQQARKEESKLEMASMRAAERHRKQASKQSTRIPATRSARKQPRTLDEKLRIRKKRDVQGIAGLQADVRNEVKRKQTNQKELSRRLV